MIKYNILSLNEWKESESFVFTKWYSDLEIKFKKYFENDIYKELEFDEFDYDSTLLTTIQTGFLFFHEKEFQYKLDIILDVDKIEDDVINDIELRLNTFSVETGENLGTIKSDIILKDINLDLIINLINEFKKEYEITDIN